MALSDIDKSPLYIDSTNSRVGIGTTSANKSSSSTALTVNTSSAGNYSALELSSGDTLNWYINSNNAAVYDVTAGTRPRIFYTNGLERMRINSNGNVFINTTTQHAGSKLTVGGTGAYIGVGGSSHQVLIGDDGSQGFLGTLSNSDLQFRTNNTERMRIGSSGHITQTGYTAYGTSAIGYIGDAANLFADSASDFAIRGTSNVTFGIGASEKMRLTSAGLVGIGTNSPSGAIVEIFTASTAVNGLKISRYTPGNYYSTLRQDNHGLAIDVGTGGTVSERVAITPNGITFNGDTAAANALDDYEEGTITNLRIYFDTDLSNTSSTGASYVTASGGIYTKIGRLVTVQFYWAGTYNANQVLLKHMENLPFTVGSSNNGFYGGNTSIPYHRGFSGYYRYNTATDYSNNINLIVTPGTTTAQFKSWAHSFISTGWPLMNAGAGQELSASLTYMTD